MVVNWRVVMVADTGSSSGRAVHVLPCAFDAHWVTVRYKISVVDKHTGAVDYASSNTHNN